MQGVIGANHEGEYAGAGATDLRRGFDELTRVARDVLGSTCSTTTGSIAPTVRTREMRGSLSSSRPTSSMLVG